MARTLIPSLSADAHLGSYHICGTCAMMPREDGGILDWRLRMYGTSNFRVVDASSFPLVPRGISRLLYFPLEKR
ncbi:hypothetical protein BJX65DRAFT_275667 [Aspergillus insuetus]